MKHTLRRLLPLLIITATAGIAMAQTESTFVFKLDASNGFTMEKLQAKFLIMNADSTQLAQGSSYNVYGTYNGYQKLYHGEATIDVKAVPGEAIIIKTESEGFETEYTDMTLPKGKQREVTMTDIKLFPIRTATELDEVVVTNSRVKMVMKGDTIVFDAAKFQLAHGDMLSAMMNQMEGLTFENGVIKMNGRKVNDLLINGQSFFKGDSSVALNNLPAFTVKDLKFYEKSSDEAYITDDMGVERDYVLDVTLKREYVQGYLGNLEGGYGTADRYVGRGFGLGFGQNFRLAAYANLNNIHNTQTATASSSGDWDPGSYASSGNADRQLGGVDYIFNPSKVLKLTGNVNLHHNDQNRDAMTSTTNFLDSGDTYGRDTSHSRSREMNVSTTHTLQLTKDKLFMEFTPKLEYRHNNTDDKNLSALFTSNPLENYRGEAIDKLLGNGMSDYSDYLKYTRLNNTPGRDNTLSLSATWKAKIKFDKENSDYFSFEAMILHENSSSFGRQDYDLSYTSHSRWKWTQNFNVSLTAAINPQRTWAR